MQLRREKSLLVICKMLRLFINTSTADDKYFLFNGENLTQQIHMQLSEKQKTLSGGFFFFCIFEIYGNFGTFSRERWPS